MQVPQQVFHVALTGDFHKPDGLLLYRDIGLDVLDGQAGIRYRPMPKYSGELEPDQIGEAHAVIVLGPRVTTRSFSRAHDLLAIGRFGVGYDSVDVEACTAADVVLVTAVGAVDRSVAEATLGWMRPDAYLINTARGGIIDEDALYEVLADRRIAGAALDCFVGEPLTAPHRFGQFENVILAPHSIAWTDEMFRDIGRTICRSIVDLARRPPGMINAAVLERRGFQQKWARLRIG
jgi:phosphoglycerate dehydrogenase-like enzyme